MLYQRIAENQNLLFPVACFQKITFSLPAAARIPCLLQCLSCKALSCRILSVLSLPYAFHLLKRFRNLLFQDCAFSYSLPNYPSLLQTCLPYPFSTKHSKGRSFQQENVRTWSLKHLQNVPCILR